MKMYKCYLSLYILHCIGNDRRRNRCRDSVSPSQREVNYRKPPHSWPWFYTWWRRLKAEQEEVFWFSLTHVLMSSDLLSPAVKEKLTADPDSEIATTSLRVSLLCPVNILPAPHEFNAVFRHPFTQRRVCPFFLLFSCFSVCLNMPLTLTCVRDPPVKLSCLPLSSTLSMWARRVCDIYAFVFPPSHPCCLWLLYALTARVCTHCAAGEDAADDPMPGADMLPPAVLWRHTLHPDEREEANLGVSCMW